MPLLSGSSRLPSSYCFCMSLKQYQTKEIYYTLVKTAKALSEKKDTTLSPIKYIGKLGHFSLWEIDFHSHFLEAFLCKKLWMNS